jgi:hypothetical protein
MIDLGPKEKVLGADKLRAYRAQGCERTMTLNGKSMAWGGVTDQAEIDGSRLQMTKFTPEEQSAAFRNSTRLTRTSTPRS